MAYNLVIVESPSKATTIKNFLGPRYKVSASYGHVRDLPKSALGVDIENDFAAHYINIRGKGELIASLRKEAKNADKIYLATDADREGEAISWHLLNALKLPEEKTRRVTFNEITKNAITTAIKNPHDIDMNLVNSQQARRILDRIVGYKLSPFLWDKVKSGLSAGRVQSVATRMVVEREQEIRNFVPEEYWTISAGLKNSDGAEIVAHYIGTDSEKNEIANEEEAKKILSSIEGKPFFVQKVTKSSKKKNPLPPFATSTLQQEASRKLGFQSEKIMRIAQELYEGVDIGTENGGFHGLITYMRTDSLRISEEAQDAAKAFILSEYGEKYYPDHTRTYKVDADAQDAHEAIRPSDVTLTPKKIKKYLSNDQYRLYKLIWDRFVASQMVSALIDTVSVDIRAGEALFRVSGSTLRFNGYLSVYDNMRAGDEENENSDELCKLPAMLEGEELTVVSVTPEQHFTKGPDYFTEGSLIKALKDRGICRPSTYAPTISTIISRKYVQRSGKNLRSTQLGEVITGLMVDNFEEIVDYEFTADMEKELDDVASGTETMNDVLNEFYGRFSKSLARAQSSVAKEEVTLVPEETGIRCEKCGRMMVVKSGRFGRFAACPGYPACKNTVKIDKDNKPVVKEEKKAEPTDLVCEVCGAPMVLRTGRYGKFYACSDYPKCKNTVRIKEELDVPCPLCDGQIITNHAKGKIFYGCSNYPACKFSSWDVPTRKKCPSCGSMLLIRKSKKALVCLNKNCKYTEPYDDQRVKDTDGN